MTPLLRAAHQRDPVHDRRHGGTRPGQPVQPRTNDGARHTIVGLDDFELIAFLAVVAESAESGEAAAS